MQTYEYRVVPAPRKSEKAKGLKTVEARFALTLTMTMNEMAREGWEYLRTDTLPAEERVGFTGRTTAFHHMMVFRRLLKSASADLKSPSLTTEATEGRAPTLGSAHGD